MPSTINWTQVQTRPTLMIPGPTEVPSEDAEKIFALVAGRRRPEDIRKAYRVLQAIFGKAS